MSGEFDPEAFKAQLKEELYNKNKSMMKELLGEMTKIFRKKQLAQSSDPVDLHAEILIREREEDEVTVLADPSRRRNASQTKNMEQSYWAKTMAQV